MDSTSADAKMPFSARGDARVTKPVPTRMAALQARIAAPVFPLDPATTRR